MSQVELSGKALSSWKMYLSEHQIFQCPDLCVLVDVQQRYWARIQPQKNVFIDFANPSVQSEGDEYWFIAKILQGSVTGRTVIYSTNINSETDPVFPKLEAWHKLSGMLLYRSRISGYRDFYNLQHAVHNITATGIAFFLKQGFDTDLPRNLVLHQLINASSHILYEAFDGDGYVCGELMNNVKDG